MTGLKQESLGLPSPRHPRHPPHMRHGSAPVARRLAGSAHSRASPAQRDAVAPAYSPGSVLFQHRAAGEPETAPHRAAASGEPESAPRAAVCCFRGADAPFDKSLSALPWCAEPPSAKADQMIAASFLYFIPFPVLTPQTTRPTVFFTRVHRCP